MRNRTIRRISSGPEAALLAAPEEAAEFTFEK